MPHGKLKRKVNEYPLRIFTIEIKNPMKKRAGSK